MTKIELTVCFNKSELGSLLEIDQNTSFIELVDNLGNFKYDIIKSRNFLNQINIIPTEIGFDLLIIAIAVQGADIRISRKKYSQDSWTREIVLNLPVSDVDTWEMVNSDICGMLQFLTGDLWELNFRTRPENYKELSKINQKNNASSSDHNFDNISLFSGGLDSLIGGIDLLSKDENTLFVSHYSNDGGATSSAQVNCFTKLKSKFDHVDVANLRMFVDFPSKLIDKKSSETTMRGRSFLFLAMASYAVSGFKKKCGIIIPENGFISINVPLDPLRLGALSTRTTHPYYINQWNLLLKNLKIKTQIYNPYQYKTKGEMVDECKDKAFLQKILKKSISCSSPTKRRYKGCSNCGKAKNAHLNKKCTPPIVNSTYQAGGSGHCGYCIPCLIRRAAINTSTLKDNTVYTLAKLDVRSLNTKYSEGIQIRSLQVAIRKLNTNPNLAFFQIHQQGPLKNTGIDEKLLTEMYIRGMKEIENLLSNVNTSYQEED